MNRSVFRFGSRVSIFSKKHILGNKLPGSVALGVSLLGLSVPALADGQWRVKFEGGDQVFFRVNPMGDYKVGYLKFGYSEKKEIKSGKNLKSLEGIEDDSVGLRPEKLEVNPPHPERGYATFQDDTKKFLVYEDGSIIGALVGRWDEIKGRKFTHNGQNYMIQTYRGPRGGRTELVRPNNMKRLVLDEVFHEDLSEKGVEVQNEVLVFGGVNSNVNLTSFIQVPTIEHKGERFEIRTDPENTFLVRARDGKKIRVGDGRWDLSDLSKVYKLSDGIVDFEKSHHRVDLEAFDVEERRFSFFKKYSFLGEKNEAEDPFTFASVFTDLVADSRKYPERYAETPVPEVVDQFSRSIKVRQNAVLLAKPGVGKSSAVKAFAALVGQGKVPDVPRSTRIIELSASQFNSGNRYTGMADNKAEALAALAIQYGVLFFFDEIHAWAGVGKSMNRDQNVLQSLKPKLASGEMVILAASTPNEYAKAFAEDTAFDQRFTKVNLEVPGRDLVIESARSFIRSQRWQQPSDEVLRYAYEMSSEDIFNYQPRALVYLLKDAYSRLPNIAVQAVTQGEIHTAALSKYKFDPASHSLETARVKFAQIRPHLEEKMIGQAEAKKAIESLASVVLSDVKDSEKVNTLLLVGPSGVGKTMIAKEFAHAMDYKNTVIDMSLFVSPFDSDALMRKIREGLLIHPFQVFILDEFEKAHPNVQNALLKILEEGELTVNLGSVETIRTGRSLFILTSNGGEEYIQSHTAPFNYRELKGVLVKDGISKSVLRRVRQIVAMTSPTRDEFKAGIKMMISEVLERESSRFGIEFLIENLGIQLDDLFSGYEPIVSNFREIQAMLTELESAIGRRVLSPGFPKEEAPIFVDFQLSDRFMSKPEKNPLVF